MIFGPHVDYKMGEVIRRINVEDFKEVSDLFTDDDYNSVEELMWLFGDPYDSNKFNAFVALNESNAIVGVIGYIISTYTDGKKEFVGVIPNSWMLINGYKGMAGVSLFKKISELGDVAIAIGGTEIARKLYPMFKYQYLIHDRYFYKVLNLFNYYKTLKRRNVLKKIGMFGVLAPSYFRRPSKKDLYKDVFFEPYSGDNFVGEENYSNVFQKKVTKNYIDWLLKCPRLTSFAFVIRKGQEKLGICVLYVQNFGNTMKGRIVHLPFLGYDKKLWASVIAKCISFLKKQGCNSISSVAINDRCQKGLYATGFINIKIHREEIYFKDPKHELDKFDINSWHFQFSEGDLGLRNFI